MACGHFSWLSFSCINYLAYTMGWTNASRMAQKVRREEQPSPVSPESGEDYRIGRTMPEAAARQVLVVWSPIDQRTYSSASSRALIRGMPAVHWLWGPSRAALYKDKGSHRGTRSKDRRTTVPRKTLDSTRSEKGAKARGFAHSAVVVDSAATTATSSPLYSNLHSSTMAGGSRY